MTPDAIIEQKKNLLWDYQQTEEKLAHARETVIRVSPMIEDLQKWLITSIDPRSHIQAEHRKLAEVVGLRAQTYKDIFDLAKNAVNEVRQYEKKLADLAKRKADLRMI